MLIDSKKMIPQVYGKERQIQVFTTLLDIILTCCKHDIDSLGEVYDAQNCPEQLLPLLSSTLNYKYNFNDTVTSNRDVIDIFSTMEKYRGSELGLKIATALSLTSLNKSLQNNELVSGTIDYINAMQDLEIVYDYENAKIEITYPNVYTLVRYLLDYVRPVGMYVELKPVVSISMKGDAMLLYAGMEDLSHEYNPNIESFVNKSFVNFSATMDNKWKENHSFDTEEGT